MSRLVLKLLKFLPESMRHELIRKRLRLPEETLSSISFKTAQSKSELEQALKLLHDAYVKENYMEPHPAGIRLTPWHLLPSTAILVAKEGDKVIATVSIICDNPLGLPLEKAFSTQEFRGGKIRIGEVSSLAVDPKYRTHHGALLFSMIRFLFHYSRDYLLLDYFVIIVHPKWKDFYESIFKFKPISQKVLMDYKFANNNPGIAEAINLQDISKMLSPYYYNKNDSNNILEFLHTKTDEELFPPRDIKKLNDIVFTPRLLRYFAVEKTDLLKNLNLREQKVVSSTYSAPEYRKLLKECHCFYEFSNNRYADDMRFQVACRGIFWIDDPKKKSEFEILDISKWGLKIQTINQLDENTVYKMKIALGEFTVAEISTKVIWSKKFGLYGLKVVEKDANWIEGIRQLNKDLFLSEEGIDETA